MKDSKIIPMSNKKYQKNAVVIFVTYAELKNVLLTYSNDGNEIENDVEKIGQIAREIHEFSSKYRRKTKKTRRSSAQGTDLLKIPRF